MLLGPVVLGIPAFQVSRMDHTSGLHGPSSLSTWKMGNETTLDLEHDGHVP